MADREDGEESSPDELAAVPSGKTLPLNLRRLTSSHLKQLAESLELPTAGSLDQLRQLIEGKLESERHVEVSNVQVVVQESQFIELKLSLMSEEGVILETTPTKQSVESELKSLQEALAEAKQESSIMHEELAAAQQKLEDEKMESARLTDELARRETATEGSGGEVAKLKEDLKAEKEKYKAMWRMTCEQSREQEKLIAAQKEEIERLKLEGRLSHSPTPSETSLPAVVNPLPEVSLPSRTRVPAPRRGKAPPIDPYSGEDPEVRIDDWLPALKRAAAWNDWSEDETLIQLAGHLRGRALQEWNLLGDECLTYDAAVKALRSRLDFGSRQIAAQEFRHCAQSEGEKVGDYIRRLEKTFRVAYGRDAIMAETRDALLYGQLHEGLLYQLMEAPAVSGATSYTSLCLAAKNEEWRQAELKKRKQYQPNQPPSQGQSNRQSSQPQPSATPSLQQSSQQSSHATSQTAPGDVGRRVSKFNRSGRKCFNCWETGHIARNCPKPKKESTGRTDTEAPTTKMVQTGQPATAPAQPDDPLQYLLSDSDDSDEVRQVRVYDKGSKPHCANVNVQGVLMSGVVDSGADITIMGGEMFKRVAVVAKLKKRDFKPPDKTPRNYDQQPFRLDGRLELDISFSDKTMKTTVYVKMDAKEPLLLSEGVCRQLEIIQYHPDVVPRVSMQARERADSGTKEITCSVPTVRVKLIQSVRVPPNQSVLTSAYLPDGDSLKGPLFVESDASLLNDKGLQVTDSVVLPTQEGQIKVMLTNNSGITQQAKEDIVIGAASPAELIEPAESECALSTGPSLRESLMRDDSPDELVGSPKVDCEQSILLRPGECLLEDPNVSLPSVRQAIVVPESQSSWRKQKLRELLAKEFKESPAPESFKAKLISLLEEYHDVFSLEEGEEGKPILYSCT